MTLLVASIPGWLSRWLLLDEVEYRSLRHSKSVCNVFKGSFWMTEVIPVNLKPPFCCVASTKLHWFIYNGFPSTALAKVGNLVSLENANSQLVSLSQLVHTATLAVHQFKASFLVDQGHSSQLATISSMTMTDSIIVCESTPGSFHSVSQESFLHFLRH